LVIRNSATTNYSRDAITELRLSGIFKAILNIDKLSEQKYFLFRDIFIVSKSSYQGKLNSEKA